MKERKLGRDLYWLCFTEEYLLLEGWVLDGWRFVRYRRGFSEDDEVVVRCSGGLEF